MSRLRTTAMSLLLLFIGIVAIPLVLLFLSPAPLLRTLANNYLPGIEIDSLQGVNVGLRTLYIARGSLGSDGFHVDIEELTLSYEPMALLRGELETLAVQQLTMELAESQPGANTQSTSSLSELVSLSENLPFTKASIDKLIVNIGNTAVHSSLNISSEPLRMIADSSSPDYQGWQLDLELNANRSNSFSGSAVLTLNEAEAFESAIEISIFDSSFALNAESGIDLEILQTTPELEDLFSIASLDTESIHLSTQLLLSNLQDAPQVSELVLAIDSPNSLLQLSQQDQDSRSGLQLQLPVSINVSAETFDSNLQASVSELRLSLNHVSEAFSAQADLELAIDEIACPDTSNCSGNTNFRIMAPSASVTDIVVNELTAIGSLNLSYRDQELRLLAPELSLSLPRIESSLAVSSADFSLDGLVMNIGDQISASAYASSTRLDPGLEQLSFTNPQWYGDIEFRNNMLTAATIFSLDQQWDTAFLLEHDLGDNSGSLEIDLRSFTFSDSKPLSSMMQQSLIETDLIAGTISGNATVDWQENTEQELQFSGPISLQLEQLSGYLQDSFFVDLDSEVNAEFTNSLGIRSSGELQASIATIDVGLPIETATWRYQFDSDRQLFTLQSLSSDVLGGKLEIPEFEYSAGRELNQMDVVISNMNLESIVSLANYPNVLVDGLISGYLPLVFSGDAITIEEGLVAALNPGGTIRYTPTNPLPSSNPSVQLVNDALSNYQYKTMNTEVYYDENGDLNMLVQLQGVNPDMNSGQPINLNVSISDNIPTLLRSLQASRVITDALEESLRE